MMKKLAADPDPATPRSSKFDDPNKVNLNALPANGPTILQRIAAMKRNGVPKIEALSLLGSWGNYDPSLVKDFPVAKPRVADEVPA